jgi:hypothetical protein
VFRAGAETGAEVKAASCNETGGHLDPEPVPGALFGAGTVACR